MSGVPKMDVTLAGTMCFVFIEKECVLEAHLGGALGEDREDGLLDFRINTAKHPPGTGTAAFRAMIDAIGAHRIQVLRGRWKPSPPYTDNLDHFLRLRWQGLSMAAAAGETFTGKMARRVLDMYPSDVYVHEPWSPRDEAYVYVRFTRMEWENGGGI